MLLFSLGHEHVFCSAHLGVGGEVRRPSQHHHFSVLYVGRRGTYALRFPQGKDPCGIPQGHRRFSLWDFSPQGTFVHFKDSCGIL